MSENVTTNETTPTIIWDCGTAYELFVSLHVLLDSDTYGIRASWAAGVRSRIPAAERRLLEEVLPFIEIPLEWLHALPEPKDAIAAMWAMRQIPAAERLLTVMNYRNCKEEGCQIIIRVAENRAWTEEDVSFFENMFGKKDKTRYNRESIITWLNWWSRPDEFGDKFLAALQAYHQAFFESEEKRIAPVLQEGLARAQELAKTLSVEELLTELSQGVHFEKVAATRELIIAPAYWITPLILYAPLSEERMILLFGARPANMSAIPGETVPDGLVRTLKALADPTRLKIIYYLSQGSHSPSELARLLHLRAPTVTHHLSELRLAGLVNLNISGHEKHYTARREAINAMCNNLNEFLDKE